MSKNFGLLQHLDKERELSEKAVSPAPRVIGDPSLQPVTGEEVVKLVQTVFCSPSPEAPRVVTFASVGHGDGCSSICTGAALVLASQFAGSFCVVDANLRTPSLHRYFGIENELGLADAIVQSGPIRGFAQQIAGSGIWVLTCGTATSNPNALLNSPNLRTRMAELRNEFEYVLLDAPPLGPYSDAITVGGLSDGIVLIVQSNATRREAAVKAKESLQAANVRLLGAVLNKRTFPIPQRLYKRL